MKFFRKLIIPYAVWMSIFIILPMLLIALYAFTSRESTDVITVRFTLDNFKQIFEFVYLNVIWKSLVIATGTTLICILIGYPIAYMIAQCSKTVQMFLILLVTIPMWINVLVRTYSLTSIISDVGLINNLLALFGIPKITMMWTDFAVYLGMVYNFLPFMILSIYNILARLDPAIVQASYDLGANRFQTFRRVVFPLSLPGVVSGITLVFLPAVSTFEIPMLLGGANYALVGTLIEKQFISLGNWNFGSAISLWVALIIMVTMHFTNKLDRSVEEMTSKTLEVGGK